MKLMGKEQSLDFGNWVEKWRIWLMLKFILASSADKSEVVVTHPYFPWIASGKEVEANLITGTVLCKLLLDSGILCFWHGFLNHSKDTRGHVSSHLRWHPLEIHSSIQTGFCSVPVSQASLPTMDSFPGTSAVVASRTGYRFCRPA